MRDASQEHHNRQKDALDKQICMLITSGHGQGVWDYGYTFFKIAIIALSDLFKAQALSVAMGVGGLFNKEAMKQLTS